MAQASSFLTYDAVGNREDLINAIFNISPTETPFLTSFQKASAEATFHEWQTDELTAAGDNAQIEGMDYTFTKAEPTTRLGNHTQIFTTLVKVSKTQNKVKAAGRKSEFAYQMAKKMKEHARDIEWALVNGTGNSGASGTARRLKGVLAWLTTTVITGTGTGDEVLTKEMFNSALQAIWSAGGRPDTAYPNGALKQVISDFTSPNTRNIGAKEKEVVVGVDIYDSDFGRIKIKPHRYMPAKVVPILQSDLWGVATLRPTEKENIAPLGSYKRAAIETELTLEARNEGGSGQIVDVVPAS